MAGGFSFGKISDGYGEIKKICDNPPANVKLLGIIDREYMNEVYNLGDVMFLPSFEELFPMTILEAMCVNLPVFLRGLDIYPDILFDFYSKADDVDGFVKELDRLHNNTECYAQRCEASQARKSLLLKRACNENVGRVLLNGQGFNQEINQSRRFHCGYIYIR